MFNSNSILNTRCADSLKNGRCSFIFTALLLHITTLKFPLKLRLSTSVNFYLHIPHLLVHKIILKISLNTPLLYASAIFYHPNNLRQIHFLCLSHLDNLGCVKGSKSSDVCEKWNCFNLRLLPKSSDNRAHNHKLFIPQAQKIGILQMVVSDADACNYTIHLL